MNEAGDMLGEMAAVEPPQADIQKISFPEDPAITLHIRAKEQLGNFATNRTLFLLADVHFKLGLLGRHNRLSSGFRSQVSRHRTEMTSGSNYQPGFELIVDKPGVAQPFQAAKSDSFNQPGARTRRKIMVELKAANSIADRLSVVRLHLGIAHAAGAKPCNRLEDFPAARIVARVDLQFLEHRRSDPSTADLVSGKPAFLEQRDVQSGSHQLPGAGRACRAGTHDYDIA